MRCRHARRRRLLRHRCERERRFHVVVHWHGAHRVVMRAVGRDVLHHQLVFGVAELDARQGLRTRERVLRQGIGRDSGRGRGDRTGERGAGGERQRFQKRPAAATGKVELLHARHSTGTDVEQLGVMRSSCLRALARRCDRRGAPRHSQPACAQDGQPARTSSRTTAVSRRHEEAADARAHWSSCPL